MKLQKATEQTVTSVPNGTYAIFGPNRRMIDAIYIMNTYESCHGNTNDINTLPIQTIGSDEIDSYYGYREILLDSNKVKLEECFIVPISEVRLDGVHIGNIETANF